MTTKEKIITAYLELALEEGFDTISVGNISKLAGIGKSSMYTYFKGMEDLEHKVCQYCQEILSKADFKIDYSSSDTQVLLQTLIQSFIDLFSDFPANAFITLIDAKKQNSETFRTLSHRIDMMIAARITVALDFCVQRGWTKMNDTDSFAAVITPYVRQLITDCEISDDNMADSIDSLAKLIEKL